MIQIKNLTKTYGKARGVEDVNLSIKKGEVFGFIGPNGAGKSTTIKCIMDLINKNQGEICVNDTPVKRNNYKIKEDMGYLPSEINLYDDLTVQKMFDYSASFYKKDCSNKIKYLVKKLDIDVSKKIDELSMGNLKKVGIVLSLMHDPKIVIMDEASSGLDPLIQEKFYEILKEEKQKGTTIFFSSHILSEIKRICDRVAIIKEGKIIEVNDIEKITHSEIYIVEISSKNIGKIKEDLKCQAIEETESSIKFICKENINELIKILSKYNISKLLVQEPDLEEVFLHYYK